MKRIDSCLAVLLLGLLLGGWGNATFAGEEHTHDDADDNAEVRQVAEQHVYWKDKHAVNPESWIKVKILGFNDFHGQISAGRRVGNRPVGSAAVLASYLEAAQQGAEDQTFIVHAGDHVGASPASSALLQDEPAISFLNMLGNEHCSFKRRMNPRCNLVGTLGNHEFDEGQSEMLRLIFGGNHATGPFLEDPYRGANFPYVSANVVDSATGRPILPPYVIKKVRGVRIAFIGAVLKDTPSIVTPTGVAGLTFLDEADAINRYIPELRARHVKAIVVLIHQGGRQTSYSGATQSDAAPVNGEIADIISRLDDEVDVVISGHTHSFTNALLKNKHGKEILVTQAFSAGTAFADINLEIDPASRDIVTKSASIITTYADAGPGLTPDPIVAQMVTQAEEKVAPLVNQIIGVASADISRSQNSAGESALGNLIADAQRAALQTDFAFMNPGGIRADLTAGNVTWGELFAIQPFGNSLVKMTLSGQQIYDLLNQQWQGQTSPRLLQVSGLAYTWDALRAVGDRVVAVSKSGAPIDRAAQYTVSVNSFIAAGGDNFTVLTQGANRAGGPLDLDALINYVRGLIQPFNAGVEGRIQRLN